MFKRSKKVKKNSSIVRKEKKNSLRESFNFSSVNVNLIYLVILFLFAGLLMIYSSSALIAYIYNNGDTFFFFKRQIVWILIGTLLGFLFFLIPTNKLKQYGSVFLLVGIGFMVYLLPEIFHVEFPLVKTLNGATRWIDFKLFDLQPSEFIKLPMIIFTASWLASPKKIPQWIEDLKKNNELLHMILSLCYTLAPFLVFGLVALLILLQRDLDTIVIIGLTFLVTFYVGGTTSAHTTITIITLISSAIFGTIAMLATPFRRERFNAWKDIVMKGKPSLTAMKSESFQVWNGIVAIGSGGIANVNDTFIFGLGYGESKQKLFFLQEAAFTDSIFAVTAEEFGIVGVLVVILGFLYFAIQGIKIANNANSKFAKNLAIGLTAWISIQGLLNIAANLAVIPFGGMPLPFFTYGGSNTIMVMIAVGILLGISRESKSKNRDTALMRRKI